VAPSLQMTACPYCHKPLPDGVRQHFFDYHGVSYERYLEALERDIPPSHIPGFELGTSTLDNVMRSVLKETVETRRRGLIKRATEMKAHYLNCKGPSRLAWFREYRTAERDLEAMEA